MKKLIAVLLALSMTLSLAVTVFAEGNERPGAK